MGNVQGHEEEMASEDYLSYRHGKIDHDMVKSLLNGELHFLFNEHTATRKQWGDIIDKIIQLLSRKINFMITHSNTLIDIRALCKNVNNMQEFFTNKHYLPCSEGISTDGVIADETAFMKVMIQFRTMLADFEQNYVSLSPDDASAELITYDGYIDSLDRSEYMLDTATQQEQEEFQKRAKELHSQVIYTKIKESSRHYYRFIFYYIDCYIQAINAIIHSRLPVDPASIANIERIVLEPGCEIFHIIRGEMTPIETLTQLKMKAERLLRTETMAVEWGKHRQEKKTWMDASRHLYPTKENLPEVTAIANEAKALLSTSDPSITSKDRAEMLARGGIMKSMVDALVQPPQSHIQPNELAKLKRMISKRRSGGNRKTKRRHKSKSKGRL